MTSVKAPFSQSVFWKTQVQYYEGHGVTAWSSDVPYRISSSCRIAFAYADMIAAYIRDVRRIDPSAAFQIVELGAGSGKFSYRLLQQLDSILGLMDQPDQKVYYTMTDCADLTRRFWLKHPQLKPFVDHEILSFEALTVDHDKGILFSGDVHSWGSPYTIIIANYFFDSIYHDAFGVKEGHVYPYLCSAPNLNASEIDAKDLIFTPDHGIKDFFACPNRNHVASLHRSVSSERFLFPTGCFDLLDFFSLHSKQILLLSADKGFTHASNFYYDKTFCLRKDGTLSTVVNYFAIAEYFKKHLLGDALLSEPYFNDARVFFSSTAFLSHGHFSNYPELHRAAKTYTEQFTHADFQILDYTAADPYLNYYDDVKMLFKLYHYDPSLAVRYHDLIATILRNTDKKLSQSMHDMLVLLTRNCYFSSNTYESQEFQAIASLCLAGKQYALAKCFLAVFKKYYGTCYGVSLVSGQYYFLMEDHETASRHFQMALQEKPSCQESERYLSILQADRDLVTKNPI